MSTTSPTEPPTAANDDHEHADTNNDTLGAASTVTDDVGGGDTLRADTDTDTDTDTAAPRPEADRGAYRALFGADPVAPGWMPWIGPISARSAATHHPAPPESASAATWRLPLGAAISARSTAIVSAGAKVAK